MGFIIDLNAQSIDGIGKLHLGMCLKDVKTIFPKSLIKRASTSKIKSLYTINSYTPIKNHTCKDLHLYFYNDTLYAIYLKDSSGNLKESLSIKYGEPQQRYVRYNTYVEALASIYESEATDFLNDRYYNRQNYSGDCFEWNSNNPFARCFFWQLTFEKGNLLGLDELFCIKNYIISKVVELEEDSLKYKEEGRKKKELEEL